MSLLLEERPARDRRLFRFMAFAIAVVIAVSALTVRLFYLQVVSGTRYVELSNSNRILLQAVPSTRGVVFDREGRPLVTNVPSFSVKIRPVDLPFPRREEVVGRVGALLGIDPAEITAALDGNPGSRFDLVRVAQDVPEEKARIIAEERLNLPGVEVVVEARRQYTDGPLFSQLIGYTGPVSAEQLESLRHEGYLPDDLIGKAGVEAVYEQELRGSYGLQNVERDATGRKIKVLSTAREPDAGSSLRLTISTREQQLAEKALRWGMKEVGVKRGVVIVMNPQTGEILAMVSLPTYDNNLFARGISAKDFKALLENPDRPLINHAIAEQYAPGSTFKLVTGTGGLAEKKIRATTELMTRPFLTLGTTKFYEWNRRGWGACDIYCGFGHSSDTYFFQVAGRLGIDTLAEWAHQYGFGERTGIDLTGEVDGIIPTDEWKMQTFGQPIFPGEVFQAGIGQGYVAVTPLQLISAYSALANGGRVFRPQVVREVIGPDGAVVRPFEPDLIRKMDVPSSVLRTMRLAAREVVTIRHTYNLVELPIVVSGKSGTAEFGVRDEKGRLPFSSWFIGFTPKDPRKGDPAKADSELAVLAFAYDSRTKGNMATEIVKYYLQLHYELKGDWRNFDLLERGNFYQGN